MKLTVYNLKRETVGEIDLSDEVFGAEVKEHLFYEVVKAQLASRRAGTKATKERSAVARLDEEALPAEGHRPRAPGLDPRAAPRRRRHGARRSSRKDWSYRPPRKVRIGALKSALSLFAKEGRLIVLDNARARRDQDQGARRRRSARSRPTRRRSSSTRRATTSS